MLRAETTNNCTAAIDTTHSTALTLLLELNVICEQRWIQFELQKSHSRVYAFDGKIHYHLANLWNRITTKIFDIFRIITLKQQKFSQSDPVLIRQIEKKNWLLSWSVLISAVFNTPEMITIWFAGCISGRIVSFQLDTDIQKVFFCGNRIRIRISGLTCLIRCFENAGLIGYEMNFGHLWTLEESCTLRNDFSVCGCILLALRAIHTSESMV